MSAKNIFSNHISFVSSEDIKIVCKPLFEYFNIIGIEYARVYPDGSRLELSSHPEYLQHSYLIKKYFIDIYTPDLLPSKDSYIFPDDWAQTQPLHLRSKLLLQLTHEREYFDFGNSFCLVKNYKEYYEYFLFFTHIDNHVIKGSYINNLDLLDRFTFYFKDKLRELIITADRNRLVLPWRKPTPVVINPINTRGAFLEAMNVKRYYIDGGLDTYLTLKEAKCAAYLLEGLNAAEIAQKMFTSKRTVEAHINNIKLKLGCNLRSELIKKLQEHGFENFGTLVGVTSEG